MRANGNLFPSIPALLENFFSNELTDSVLATGQNAATLPAVNIIETNDDYRIEMAAPGMKRDDFRVELDNNQLTISSVTENASDSKDQYLRREYNYGAFQRSFTLPENEVEGEQIAARYEDGILHIVVPKKEEAKIKPVRQIAVA